MKVLALNYGSSSIKFLLAEDNPGNDDFTPLARGQINGIGSSQSAVRLNFLDRPSVQESLVVSDHTEGAKNIFDLLRRYEGFSPSSIDAVGHRFVHGGDVFTEPTMVDQQVLSALEDLNDLAPLHNPVSLKGIHECRGLLGETVPMVCVFDTAFHHGMPPIASTYAIPHTLATRHRIKRYGFHGIAHSSLIHGYVALRGPTHDHDRVITMHLGNGCSIAASQRGQSVDTSMGFTPLEGLVMGTRSGDLDPAVVGYLAEKESLSCSDVEQLLNHESGLLGVSGQSSDMRDLLKAAGQDHDERSALAVDLFCYRARKYLGAYLAALGGAEAVIFGGGIGEGSPEIRHRICQNMEWCGLELDPLQNHEGINLSPGEAACLSPNHATLPVYVVAADEEMMITQQTVECLTRNKNV